MLSVVVALAAGVDPQTGITHLVPTLTALLSWTIKRACQEVNDLGPRKPCSPLTLTGKTTLTLFVLCRKLKMT